MRQRRRNSTHHLPPLKVRGGAYIKFYTESRNGIRSSLSCPSPYQSFLVTVSDKYLRMIMSGELSLSLAILASWVSAAKWTTPANTSSPTAFATDNTPLKISQSLPEK